MTNTTGARSPIPATQSHSLPEKFLGKSPADVVELVKTGAEAVDQLEWLLKEIKRRLDDDYANHPALPLIEVRRIVEISLTITANTGDYLNDHAEDLQKALNAEVAP